MASWTVVEKRNARNHRNPVANVFGSITDVVTFAAARKQRVTRRPRVRRLIILALGTLMCGLVSSVASAQAGPDWQAVEAEAIRTIQAYVRINTSNPPGDVIKAADFLTGLL